MHTRIKYEGGYSPIKDLRIKLGGEWTSIRQQWNKINGVWYQTYQQYEPTGGSEEYSYTSFGSYNLTVPYGCAKVKIECIGAGGGGGAGMMGSTSTAGGGGGGSGYRSIDYFDVGKGNVIQPNENLSINVGYGGLGGNDIGNASTAGENGADGDRSYVQFGTTLIIEASGGRGGGGAGGNGECPGDGGAGGIGEYNGSSGGVNCENTSWVEGGSFGETPSGYGNGGLGGGSTSTTEGEGNIGVEGAIIVTFYDKYNIPIINIPDFSYTSDAYREYDFYIEEGYDISQVYLYIDALVTDVPVYSSSITLKSPNNSTFVQTYNSPLNSQQQFGPLSNFSSDPTSKGTWKFIVQTGGGGGYTSIGLTRIRIGFNEIPP